MMRAAAAAVAYVAGDVRKLNDACTKHGAMYEDVCNTLKKWRAKSTLQAHVEAHNRRKAAAPVLEQANRSIVLANAVKAMKAGKLSVREGVAECKAHGV